MLKLTMSLAYRIVFECPKDRKNINLEKKCRNISLSESDAMKMFGNEDITCTNPNCGWHGKASRTRLLRILPFDCVGQNKEALANVSESDHAYREIRESSSFAE